MRTGGYILPSNIEELILKAKDILEKHNSIIFAYLFGGLAKGRISPISDIDIAVYLRETENLLEVKLEILSLLSEVLNTDEIDLVILNTAPLPLKARIIQNKKVLVDKDPSLRYSFESLTLREYFDFSIKERDILYRRYNIVR
ncbi:nucleotidyltransferase domain-containing protein [bacterium]|nr:nucleotidyltransferase domain-containing protein [bacterium]